MYSAAEWYVADKEELSKAVPQVVIMESDAVSLSEEEYLAEQFDMTCNYEPQSTIRVHNDDPTQWTDSIHLMHLPSDLVQKHPSLNTYACLEDLLSQKPEENILPIEVLQPSLDDSDDEHYHTRFKPLQPTNTLPPPPSDMPIHYQHSHKQNHTPRLLRKDSVNSQDEVEHEHHAMSILRSINQGSTPSSQQSGYGFNQGNLQVSGPPSPGSASMSISPPSENMLRDGPIKLESPIGGIQLDSSTRQQSRHTEQAQPFKRHSRALTVPIRMKSHTRLTSLNEQPHQLNDISAASSSIKLSGPGKRPLPSIPAGVTVKARSQSYPHLSSHIPNPDPAQEAFFNELKGKIWKLARELEQLHPSSQDLLRAPKPVPVDIESPLEEGDHLFMVPPKRPSLLKIQGDDFGPGSSNGQDAGPHAETGFGEGDSENGATLEPIKRKNEGRGRKWRKMQPAFGFKGKD